MDSFGNDVAQKMKAALKAKLIELDAYVDDELPEYIMVMVANKKTKAQMAEDLSLFLGENTELFTDWLHDVLNRLQAVAIRKTDSKSQRSDKDRHGESKKSPKTAAVKEETKPVVGTSERRSSSSRSSREDPPSLTAPPGISKLKCKQEVAEEVEEEDVEEETEASPDEENNEPEVTPDEDQEEVEETAEGAAEDNEEKNSASDDDDKKGGAQEADQGESEGVGDADPQFEFLAIKAEQESDDLLGEELQDQPPPLPPPLPPPTPQEPPLKRKRLEPAPRKSIFSHKLSSSSSMPSSSSSKPAPRAVRVGSDPSYIPISLTSSSSKSRVTESRVIQSTSRRTVTSDRSTSVAGLKRRAPSSAVGAVVRRQFPQEEDEGEEEKYDKRRPLIGSVASTVQVSQRRSSLPVNRQANTTLLLKAVNEAQKSILQSTQRATCLPVRESTSPPKLFTRGYLQRHPQEDTKFQSSKYIAEKFLPRFTIKRPKEELSLQVSVVSRAAKPSPPTTTKRVETVEMADSTEHLSEDDSGDAEETEEAATPRESRVESDNEVVEEVEELEEAEEVEEEEQEDEKLEAETTVTEKQSVHRPQVETRPPPPTSPNFFITLDGVGSTLFGSRLKNRHLLEDAEEMDVTPPMPPPPPYVASQTTAPASAATNRGIRWELRGRSATVDDMLDVDDQQAVMPDYGLDGIQFVVINRDPDQTYEEMDTVDPGDRSDANWTTEEMEQLPSIQAASRKKFEERCRYWPTCKNGATCEYHHPTIPCKTFPNCKFGNQCRYIHPNCKFLAACSKRGCPYTHVVPPPRAAAVVEVPFTSTPVRRPLTSRPVQASLSAAPTSKIRCRNFPTCNNVDCTFYHPLPCRYASRCTRPDCIFFHPDAPSREQMKWSKTQVKEVLNPPHISERSFAVGQAHQKIVVTTAKAAEK